MIDGMNILELKILQKYKILQTSIDSVITYSIWENNICLLGVFFHL